MHNIRQRQWNLFVWPRLPGVRHILLMITLRTLHNTLSVCAGPAAVHPQHHFLPHIFIAFLYKFSFRSVVPRVLVTGGFNKLNIGLRQLCCKMHELNLSPLPLWPWSGGSTATAPGDRLTFRPSHLHVMGRTDYETRKVDSAALPMCGT